MKSTSLGLSLYEQGEKFAITGDKGLNASLQKIDDTLVELGKNGAETQKNVENLSQNQHTANEDIDKIKQSINELVNNQLPKDYVQNAVNEYVATHFSDILKDYYTKTETDTNFVSKVGLADKGYLSTEALTLVLNGYAKTDVTSDHEKRISDLEKGGGSSGSGGSESGGSSSEKITELETRVATLEQTIEGLAEALHTLNAGKTEETDGGDS